ncbi:MULTISPECIES: hydantoinase B/oxoprolinase family protein [Rhodanobacter]|uniref:hydantoinase B/oxoprolinase family protein n=1 Tax=Rhodanobacter TaxID=75309 RepID=UPI0003FC1D41|nr:MULTISPECIES: hydantoinase B/oxoprolinase family protein [Rhodanobacter]TAN17500.1 MAG: hydantoinase B/oxoprolinase family protein [Rhodanobacter sp.]UJJ56436.1 hydantoinase B/oxoprolinase family protein [Rhodanobacter thiooxydans]
MIDSSKILSASDAITLEIIQSSLQAIADEMFAALRKTAMSAVIYEVLDAGTGITDGKGNLASSGAGIPGFVGVLDKSVKRVLELHSKSGDIQPGDVFITNDPYYGGVTHLNDNILLMPVFADGEIVAWTANIAHWNDVGGAFPGSLSPAAKEIFQEGLRLPAVKLIDRGQPIRAVLDIIRVNTRLPAFLEGDLWAGVASARIGAKRIEELVAKYGKGIFIAAMKQFMDYGEQVARNGLRALPKGRYSIEEEQDSGVVYKATIEITDDAFIVDLRDNPDQDTGPNNCSHDDSIVSAQMIFKNITGSYGVTNGGTFRPLQVLTRPGSVFNAQEPAAVGIYYEVGMRLYDLLWRCLAPHLGDRLPSGHFSSICGTFIGGTNPDTGRYFTIVEPQIGGWGGSAQGDGNNAMFSSMHGETFNCPVEIAETRYGLYVDRLSLNDEPGGEGEHRGGKGIVLEYRVRSDNCFLTASYSRNKHRPWAMRGGKEGSANYIRVIRANGEAQNLAIVNTLTVNRDDVIRIVTASGAGYGDPKKRARAAVEDDIKNGYISRERVAEIYG